MVSKPLSSVDDVVAELLRTNEDIRLSAELIAEAAAEDTGVSVSVEILLADYYNLFQSFLSTYDIKFPIYAPDSDVFSEIGGILARNGQDGLEAVKGFVKMAGKLTYFARDNNEDPRKYVSGMAEILSGLDLEELYVHPNRNAQLPSDQSIRDKISELLSLEKEGEQFMYNLIGGPLPEIAGRVKNEAPAHYSNFLHQALDEMKARYGTDASTSDFVDLMDERAESWISTLAPEAQETQSVAFSDKTLRPEELETALFNPKGDLVHPGNLLAIIASGRFSDGGNSRAGIIFGDMANPSNNATWLTNYGSKGVPKPVANYLMSIQADLPAAHPQHPLSPTHARAVNFLKHHATQ